MARLLGLLLLIGLGWLVIRQLSGRGRIRTHRAPPAQRFEKTVRCAECGVHLPLSIARRDGERYVCTDSDCQDRR